MVRLTSCNVTVTECLLSGWNIAGVRGMARERDSGYNSVKAC